MRQIKVTREQAALLASAEQAKAQAIQHANTIANAMCAGHVPDGAQLVDVNTDTGVLTFHVAPSLDETRRITDALDTTATDA